MYHPANPRERMEDNTRDKSASQRYQRAPVLCCQGGIKHYMLRHLPTALLHRRLLEHEVTSTRNVAAKGRRESEQVGGKVYHLER